MWKNNRLTKLLGVEHPLIQSPMAGIAPVELAAEVCEAGGLGSLGCVAMRPEAVVAAIAQMRALTARPFNVNFFCHGSTDFRSRPAHVWREHLGAYRVELDFEFDDSSSSQEIRPFDDAMCSAIEQTRPAVVSFHFGLPPPTLLARVKAAGCVVLSSATTLDEAVWLEARGADGVIAQGLEAGGHRGTFLADDIDASVATQLGTFALVPLLSDTLDVPVVAAGGIADGRGIAAALALGATGVQIGTAFLLCPEAKTSQQYRHALRDPAARTTVVSNVFTGHPARAISNRLSEEAGPMSSFAPGFPFAGDTSMQLRRAAERKGSTAFTPFWAGQAAAQIRELPARTLTRLLISETMDCFQGWKARFQD